MNSNSGLSSPQAVRYFVMIMQRKQGKKGEKKQTQNIPASVWSELLLPARETWALCSMLGLFALDRHRNKKKASKTARSAESGAATHRDDAEIWLLKKYSFAA